MPANIVGCNFEYLVTKEKDLQSRVLSFLAKQAARYFIPLKYDLFTEKDLRRNLLYIDYQKECFISNIDKKQQQNL